jgi:aminoglycoside phosphotransferase (APT) family kinase protein
VNPLEVVLTPPQRARLRELLDLPDLSEVELTAEGWHRFAVLAPDRVLLLPRNHRWVPGLEREAAALEVLEAAEVPAPRLLQRIDDPELWPYPVTVVSRYRARSWAAYQDAATPAEVEEMLAGLGRLIAGYHAIDVGCLPAVIAAPPPGSPDPFEARLRHFDDYLEPGRLEKIGYGLASAAGLPGSRVEHWLTVLQPLLDLAPTLVHRDINEGQILIDPDRPPGRPVAGLIDWESSGVQHPLSDFDFGEWGPGIWDHEPDFGRLRRVLWESYAAARAVELPDWRAMHLLMTIIGAPPPEGLGTAWNDLRHARTIANLRSIDALV